MIIAEEKRAKIMEIINHEEGITMALETLSNTTQNEIEYARLCNQIKSELDQQSRETRARREGRDEVLNLLDQGLTINEIKERLRQKECVS